MLVTLYLIASNVYGAVEAPKLRGFSKIELWMVGVQMTMLLGLFEYGIVLSILKFSPKNGIEHLYPGDLEKSQKVKMEPKNLANIMDKCTFALAASFIIVFNVFYWCFALLA